MPIPKLPNAASTANHNDNRRRSGRVRCELVRCSMGEVLDISAGGMRVFRRNRPGPHAGDTVVVTIAALGREIKTPVRIGRVDCLGLFHVEVGLEFVEITAPLREALNEIARSSATSSIFLHSQTGNSRAA